MTLMIAFETRPCMHCGKRDRVVLEKAKFDRWDAGELVQDVWPEKTRPERELLTTGIHGPCWDAMFADEEDVTEVGPPVVHWPEGIWNEKPETNPDPFQRDSTGNAVGFLEDDPMQREW